LEFHDLIVTVAGLSNVSAVTVHAYKRYKIGDVLIGFNFAPIVFRDTETGLLEVDLARANDVREQSGLGGENLSIRRSNGNEEKDRVKDDRSRFSLSSNIRIKRSRMGSDFGSKMPLHRSVGSVGRSVSLLGIIETKSDIPANNVRE
jgi:hypothetical protein